jgi:hypothetical protein
MLNSLANFAYNNTEFVYPTLTEFKIDFSDLSHPLLNANTRIGNKVFSSSVFYDIDWVKYVW